MTIPACLSAVIVFLFVCIQLSQSKTTPRSQIREIPGYGAPPTTHYSGFVEVEPATGTHLFYYIVESTSTNPESDPLIWWMNGGPGASSFAGLFTENGPLLLNQSSGSHSFAENPYKWNSVANLLYVEFAPGIGFSYCDNSTTTALSECNQTRGDCNPCWASDTSVVDQNVKALELLLSDDLFKEYRGRPLYLAGESYAGVYIPTLAEALLSKYAATDFINLKGLWATDPCLDNKMQFGWLDMSPEFAYQKGLISGSIYELLSSNECTNGRTAVGDWHRNLSNLDCRRAWRLYDMVFAGLGNAVHPNAIASLPIYVDPLNAIGLVGGADIEEYLNRKDVRIAFNAQQSKNKIYHIEIGNNGYPQYELQYSACNDKATDKQSSMIKVYQSIVKLAAKQVKQDISIIISSGDVDPVVALHGTEQAVRSIGLPTAKDMPRRPWFFNSSATPVSFLSSKPLSFGQALHAHDAGAQVGGFTETFESKDHIKINFVTVRNSGHMVPAYAPQKSMHIIRKLLINNSSLAPPLESGWDITSTSSWRGSVGHPGIFARYIQRAMSKEFLQELSAEKV